MKRKPKIERIEILAKADYVINYAKANVTSNSEVQELEQFASKLASLSSSTESQAIRNLELGRKYYRVSPFIHREPFIAIYHRDQSLSHGLVLGRYCDAL